MKKLVSYSICTSVVLLALTACDPVKEEKGYRMDQEAIATIEKGVSTKEDVLEKMGSPSSVSTFPDQGEAWYYINKKTEHYAFLEKNILEQNVVVVKFDTSEIVSGIQNYDKDDRREINVVERTTPTGGNELGFFEQIFGNFGRFNAPAGGSPF